jgi:UPF0716 protein FxsA
MIVALLILWPLAELAAAVVVAHFVGVLVCVILLLAGWPLGTHLLRSEGRGALRRLRAALDAGRPPAAEVADGALVLLGGTLLIVPGFITDAIGLVALVPAVRRRLGGLLVRHARSRVVGRAARFGAGPRRAYDVDAVAHDVPPTPRPGLPG